MITMASTSIESKIVDASKFLRAKSSPIMALVKKSQSIPAFKRTRRDAPLLLAFFGSTG